MRHTFFGALRVVAAASVMGCSLLTRPSQHAVKAPPAALMAENVTFASSSGSSIHGWFMKGDAGSGAVLLLHGVGADRSSMQGRAQFLHDEGFTVLAPDFQAHGESPGEHVTFGARESLDAAAAIQFLHVVAPGERVGVIGVSMGGAASLLGPGPLVADAFVLESVYPTIRQAFRNRLSTWFGPLGIVSRQFTGLGLRLISRSIGVAESELQPISRIAKLHAPLLMMAGTVDPYTPLAESESLFAMAQAPKTFWAVSGAAHEDLHAYKPAEYEQRVNAFLLRYLRPVAGDAGGGAIATSAGSVNANSVSLRVRRQR